MKNKGTCFGVKYVNQRLWRQHVLVRVNFSDVILPSA